MNHHVAAKEYYGPEKRSRHRGSPYARKLVGARHKRRHEAQRGLRERARTGRRRFG